VAACPVSVWLAELDRSRARDEAACRSSRVGAAIAYGLIRLLYPGRETRCSQCRQALTVRCPIDDTLRPATEQTCTACGTRYVLGASDTSIAVQRRSGPPAGGQAVA
jgi:hypothetical protein